MLDDKSLRLDISFKYLRYTVKANIKRKGITVCVQVVGKYNILRKRIVFTCTIFVRKEFKLFLIINESKILGKYVIQFARDFAFKKYLNCIIFVYR